MNLAAAARSIARERAKDLRLHAYLARVYLKHGYVKLFALETHLLRNLADAMRLSQRRTKGLAKRKTE